MKKFILIFFLWFFCSQNSVYSQFHDYSIKYGIQGHLLQPSSEFDGDAYRLSLLARGFLRIELNSYLETELGAALGEINGKDFNNDNWSTKVLPTDLRLIFSPLTSTVSSPYLYFGISLLKWEISDFPSLISPNPTSENGWNLSIPLGGGIEIALNPEVLLDISGGYTFALTDNLNFYNSPTTEDGYYNLGFGLTFVMGGSLTDKDNDGLKMNFENKIGTDPTKRDTDGDNLNDGDEVKLYQTNPLVKDSDNDGLNDFEEIKRYKSDPNSPDTDGDNISDFEEVENYGTNPNMKDSDGDKLNDNNEINIYNTNPLKKDSDIDLLFDNDEIKKYKTDPNKPDTDGDGVLDGIEILEDKTDPLEKSSKRINIKLKSQDLSFDDNKPVILEGIRFENDIAIIDASSANTLKKTFTALKNNPSLKIEIHGYTDNVGQEEYNKNLSQQRADAVRLWLVKKGIDALRINTVGYGELNPISDNSTLEGRNLNRRIEIIKSN